MKIVEGNQHNRLAKSILGAHPIIRFYLEKLRLREIFRCYVQSDARLAIPVEDVVCLLIHNILTDPLPLYKIPQWLESLDMESLGLGKHDANIFNDDRLGRVPDAIANSNRKMIFLRIALRSIKIFELNYRRIHHDTTSIKFCGRYENWQQEPKADHGHSKDHRPDLKQLVLGINVVGDGAVPISHEPYNGNRTDDTVHISNWDRLRRLLQTNDFIYTADSKLCTDKNLSHIEFYHGQYITVMPRTWKEDNEFRQLAREDKVKWRLILKRKNNRHPNQVTDKYYTTTTDFQTHCERRLVWIKSTQKAVVDRQTRAKRIEKTLAALSELSTKLNRYKLKRFPDIKQAVKTILTEHKTTDLISCAIDKRTITARRYLKKGRPTTNSPFKAKRKAEYRLSYHINQEELAKQSRVDGVFPLITNNEVKTAKEILEIYKYQPFLEKRHSQLKASLEVAPVFLKNPGRVLALVDLVVLSLCVATLMERDLRNGMKRKGLKSIPIYPEQRECQRPTAHSIVWAFKETEKFEMFDRDDNVIEYFPAKLSSLQKQILNLMRVPESLYA